MPKCAYCSLEAKMTREHVIPKFLYEFQKILSKSNIGWNEVIGKMIAGEATVKDVCEKCNGERLGPLDYAAKTVLGSANLLVYNYTRSTIILNYDYDLLIRWLLKVSFNSTRIDKAHSYMFTSHIRYMLYGIGRVHRSKIAVLAYFAGPETLNAGQQKLKNFSTIANGSKTFNPFLVRICYGHVLGEKNYTVRMVTIGALVFFMLIFENEVLPGHAASSIRAFKKLNPFAVELFPSIKLVTLRPGRLTWLDLYEHQLLRVQSINDRRSSK
jgi:hypothetical protein